MIYANNVNLTRIIVYLVKVIPGKGNNVNVYKGMRKLI